jgi:hypothetical protein
VGIIGSGGAGRFIGWGATENWLGNVPFLSPLLLDELLFSSENNDLYFWGSYDDNPETHNFALSNCKTREPTPIYQADT